MASKATECVLDNGGLLLPTRVRRAVCGVPLIADSLVRGSSGSLILPLRYPRAVLPHVVPSLGISDYGRVPFVLLLRHCTARVI